MNHQYKHIFCTVPSALRDQELNAVRLSSRTKGVEPAGAAVNSARQRSAPDSRDTRPTWTYAAVPQLERQ